MKKKKNEHAAYEGCCQETLSMKSMTAPVSSEETEVSLKTWRRAIHSAVSLNSLPVSYNKAEASRAIIHS